jgi:Spy/CpxP family protein refolding chaperone
MSNRKKVLIAAVAVLALMAGSGLIWAQMGPGFGPFGMHRGQRMLQFVTDYLDLTASQQAEAKALWQTTHQSNQNAITQLKQVAEQAREAVKAGKPDAELQQIANSIGPLVSQIAANDLKSMSKFYSTLTPDQKAKLDRLHENMRARFMERHHGQAPQSAK